MSDCSTHAFDVPLRECPFCKSEAFVRLDITLHPTQSRYRVGCDKDSNCHGWYGHSRYYSTEAEAIAAWNTRAAHGTLTAEQVREATYAHSIHADCADADWQVIADELNSRAERTCEFKPFRGPISDTDEIGDRKGVCSICSAYMHEQYNYCPNCGAKVVGE